MRDLAAPHVVAVDVQQPAHGEVDDREQHRDDECVPERRDVDAVEHRGGRPHEERVEHEREQPDGPEDQWQRQADHDRPHERVEHAEHDDHAERRGEPVDRQSVEDLRGEQEHERLHDAEHGDPNQSPGSRRTLNGQRLRGDGRHRATASTGGCQSGSASSNRSNSKPGDTVLPTSVHAPSLRADCHSPGSTTSCGRSPPAKSVAESPRHHGSPFRPGPQLERGTGVVVPDLRTVDSVPVRLLTAAEQEVDRRAARTAGGGTCLPGLHVVPALRMRLEPEQVRSVGRGRSRACSTAP